MKAKKVLIVGVGGLGVPAAVRLAMTGQVELGLVDPEAVELSNLGRQFIYGLPDIGRLKVEAAADYLLSHFRLPAVRTYPIRLDHVSAEGLIEGYDFVIDATDDPQTKFLINDVSVALDRPFCYGGVLGFRGQAMTVLPGKTACLRCLFEHPPLEGEVASCREAGIIGSAAGIIGFVQAREATAYLLDGKSPLAGKLYFYDGLGKVVSRVIPVGLRPGCKCTEGGKAAKSDLKRTLATSIRP